MHTHTHTHTQKVDLVMLLYKEALNKSTHKGHVSQLINMEETINEEDGSRFLLELVVELTNPQEFVNTSEYVYLKTGSDKLCHTSNFQWQRGVKVYLVVTGGWDLFLGATFACMHGDSEILQYMLIILLSFTVKNLSFWINHLMQNLEEVSSESHIIIVPGVHALLIVHNIILWIITSLCL